MAKWKMDFFTLPTKDQPTSKTLRSFERESGDRQPVVDELCERVFRFAKQAGINAKPDAERCACQLTLTHNDETRAVFTSQQFPVTAIDAVGQLLQAPTIGEALQPAGK